MTLLAAVALAGCASQLSELPVVGLPAGAPERPAQEYAYPAVHDMPEPRATRPMTNEELKNAAAELADVRDRQPGRARPQAAKPAPAVIRRPPETAGSTRNP